MVAKSFDPHTSHPFKSEKIQISRRSLFQSTTGVPLAFGLANGVHAKPKSKAFDNAHPILAGNRNQRSAKAMQIRNAASRTWLQNFLGDQETNDDEGLYDDYRASFTKALPHNELGEVDTAQYQNLLAALESRRNEDFEAISLGGARKLANPQGAYRFEMVGRDAHNTLMRPAPVFAGDETAAEMGELYWKALCRDVPFFDYDTDPLIDAAVRDLNAFSETVGPDGGVLTTGNIFRGETPGDLNGPYISQLLLKDIPFGNSTLVQRYAKPTGGVDFMTSPEEWLAVQRGNVPGNMKKDGGFYIYNARALGEFVHVDFSYQAYQSAALILLGIPDSFDLNNLYNTSSTQGAFVTLGGPDVLDLVAKAGNLSLTGAWYQKWLVHRRLRPETYSGRLHFQKTGVKHYGLPDEIAGCDGVARTFTKNSSYFLPMAFAEGSPIHPSYPAGHATIAGACCTVLKAFFNEEALIPDPVTPNWDGSTTLPYGGSLTIGGEITKIANNIALGRDWAGLHYRSDGVDGLLVGEQQAIGLLQDYSRTYNEEFAGFKLTKFNGSPILIRGGMVY